MIEIRGEGGESLIFDGAMVSKFRHDGKEQSASNPASTFREVRVKAKKTKKGQEQRYDVLLACATIFSLTITESEKPKLDQMVAELETLAAG